MKGRTKNIRKHVGRAILAVVLLALVVTYLAAEKHYRRQKRAFYEEKKAALAEQMIGEKAWIHGNTGENGVIYMNTTNGAQDVNPYFACQAALGLLAGEPRTEDFDAVAAYLDWHSQQLITYDGIVGNYVTKNGELIPTGSYDSVDSYIALYLTVLHNYESKGGRLDLLTQWQDAVEICAERLAELTKNGLTQVSGENPVSYLMDNVEVWEASKGMAELLGSEIPELANWNEASALRAFFEEQERQIAEAVMRRLWTDAEQRYEIGLDGKERVLKFNGWEEFYPSAVAQIYPAAAGMDMKRSKALYERLCETFSWEYLKLDTTFEWPVLAYVAAVCKDEKRPGIYMEEFQKKYRTNRKYPLHTASCGWVARACEQLILLYEDRASSGLLEDIFRREELNYEAK